jgi:hypothetical protein
VGSVFLSENDRRNVFDRIFQTFSDQLFHCLGLASSLLWQYQWFSTDSSSWLSARKDRELLTPFGRVPMPRTWIVEEGLAWNVELLSSLEDKYTDEVQMNIITPPKLSLKQLVMDI